ncbi:hypothetical protein [Sulfitobacter sp. 1A15299]|uniref:hypothetical protein n=1 Tax=Sulfitobacter sp. 1A15299 TaxID=3368598 RepID=UPI003747086F
MRLLKKLLKASKKSGVPTARSASRNCSIAIFISLSPKDTPESDQNSKNTTPKGVYSPITIGAIIRAKLCSKTRNKMGYQGER